MARHDHPRPPSLLPRGGGSQIRVDQVGYVVGESTTAYPMTAHPGPHTGWAVPGVNAGAYVETQPCETAGSLGFERRSTGVRVPGT
jgi:hypothetical protein